MIKAEIRSYIKNLLPKYSQGSEYHDEVVDRGIERAINTLYLEVYRRDPNALQRYVKRFGTTTTVSVSSDAIAGIYYSSFPTGVLPVAIPDKSSGVRRIAQRTQGGIKFYPMSQREMDLVMNGSYYDTITNTIGYVVTRERVEYYNMTAPIAALGVRMDILVPFSDYEETDDIQIPEITDYEGGTFTELVLKELGIIIPQETVDDNLTTPQNTKE